MAESFPCIICGCTLERVFDDYEAQPNRGVACSTEGQYGSTVFDPMDMSYLAFNICDDCLVTAGEKGRVHVSRDRRPVVMEGVGIIGYQRVDRPYIPWHQALPLDEDRLTFEPEDLDSDLPNRVTLGFSIEELKANFPNRETA